MFGESPTVLQGFFRHEITEKPPNGEIIFFVYFRNFRNFRSFLQAREEFFFEYPGANQLA